MMRGPRTIRTYRRRSKNDEGKQQFSLDVQARGCDELLARMELSAQPRIDYVDDGRAGDDFLTRSGHGHCSRKQCAVT